MANKITPISGFPEYLPAQQLAFNTICHNIKKVYESFGYVPLETPVVERIDTLISKGIDSKEVYALRRLNVQEGDDGAKDLALRFDLTVPLARYTAQHYANLTFPFRRYQCQPVWRGERPKKGRERQFHQFDIDYIADGQGNLPLAADAEILAAAYQALQAILPAGQTFTMRVNNRVLLQSIFTQNGYTTPEHRHAALKIIDDLEKFPRSEILTRLATITPKSQPETLLQTLTNSKLENLQNLNGTNELQTVIQTAKSLLGTNANIIPDLTIARGLDYYTGTVVETRLESAPELGSICSGGRYENLAESLSDRPLPGVGISIGITRLCEWLMPQPPYNTFAATPADVYVSYGLGTTASQLRTLGLKVEEGLEDKPLGKQLIAAEKRGHRQAITKVEGTTYTLRTLATRSDETFTSLSTLAQALTATKNA